MAIIAEVTERQTQPSTQISVDVRIKIGCKLFHQSKLGSGMITWKPEQRVLGCRRLPDDDGLLLTFSLSLVLLHRHDKLVNIPVAR